MKYEYNITLKLSNLLLPNMAIECMQLEIWKNKLKNTVTLKTGWPHALTEHTEKQQHTNIPTDTK